MGPEDNEPLHGTCSITCKLTGIIWQRTAWGQRAFPCNVLSSKRGGQAAPGTEQPALPLMGGGHQSPETPVTSEQEGGDGSEPDRPFPRSSLGKVLLAQLHIVTLPTGWAGWDSPGTTHGEAAQPRSSQPARTCRAQTPATPRSFQNPTIPGGCRPQFL